MPARTAIIVSEIRRCCEGNVSAGIPSALSYENRSLPLHTFMDPQKLNQLHQGMRDVADFPKPGILFKDITTLLSDPHLFKLSLDAIQSTMEGEKIDKIVGIDARGFIFAGALADRLGAGLVPVRKKGKLPWKTESVSYDLEYGSATVEIHADAVTPGERIWLVDDVLATGGTSAAAVELVQRLGGTVAGMTFLVELTVLQGRKRLPSDLPIHGILVY
jgi:adenine phosphoribosyltransferase